MLGDGHAYPWWTRNATPRSRRMFAQARSDDRVYDRGTNSPEKKAADLDLSYLVKNLPHTLEKLKAAKYIRESPAAGGEYEFYVEFIRKWIVTNVSDKDIL